MSAKTPALIPIHLNGVHVFLILGDRPILVDTGYPNTLDKLVPALSQHGVEPSSISLILITHGHYDHYGNLAGLKRLTGAPVAVHRADAETLMSGKDPAIHPVGLAGRLLQKALSRQASHGLPPVNPDILLEGETSLAPYGTEGRVIPTPGHTPGSVSVALPGGEIIVGDLIMCGLFLRHRPGWPFFADDINQVRESVQEVLRLSPKMIHPSHGGPFNLREVQAKFS